MQTLVINLWGGPGCGKSTTAAGLFHRLKTTGESVELVTEYAKDLCWDGRKPPFDALSILAEQAKRQRRLVGKVRLIVTDSPLPLPIIYADSPFNYPWFRDACLGAFSTFNNFNVMLQRVKPFDPRGRVHSETEARMKDLDIRELPIKFHLEVAGDESAPSLIHKHLNYSPNADLEGATARARAAIKAGGSREASHRNPEGEPRPSHQEVGQRGDNAHS